MTFLYSRPFEELLVAAQKDGVPTARVVIVGSGYGGAVAAYRLAQCDPRGRGHAVIVLERGREYALGEFPGNFAELPGQLRVRRPDQPDVSGNEDALFDLRVGSGVDVLVGSGLGGTSLINANVALQPDPAVFQQPPWPAALAAESRDTPFESTALGRAFAQVRDRLGVNAAGAPDTPKGRAFDRFARSLELQPSAAPIAVNFASGPGNKAGVVQPPCTGCGNCVTGCNVGAKNTLAMNLIPAAKALGAEFYTGATVLDVRPIEKPGDGPRWSVRVRATSRETRAHHSGDLEIHADVVILAGGTLGSTEILQRSAAEGDLSVSRRLGERFSTNGDALAMSFAGHDRVDAMGAADPNAQASCGPTITRMAAGTVKTPAGASSFVLEDGAVPYSIRELVGELVTTAAQLGRLGDNTLPGWFEDHPDRDPLGVHDAALDRSQLFLVMSHDGSRGSLHYDTSFGTETGWLVPHWPSVDSADAATNPTPLDAIDELLSSRDRKPGLDHAQYVANPAWRPLPRAANGVLGDAVPGGRLITVHPLGGCPMADTGRLGVVNDTGAVFCGDGTEVHDGLHVLDGAIVPTSLGVNPFLTIAALAWRACDAILARLGESPRPAAPVLQPPRVEKPLVTARCSDSPIVIRERLVGRLVGKPTADQLKAIKALDDDPHRWYELDGLVLELETDPESPPPGAVEGETYLDALLRGRGRVPIKAALYRNTVEADEVRNARMSGIFEEHRGVLLPIATGTGSITVLAPRPPHGKVELISRSLQAVRAYLSRSGSTLATVADVLRRARSGRGSAGVRGVLCNWLSVIAMHSTYRDFEYEITFVRTSPGAGSDSFVLKGRKRVAYRRNHDRLWQSLLRLPGTLTVGSGSSKPIPLILDVDTRYMVSAGLLRIAQGPAVSVPHGILNAVAFLGRFARSIFQTSLWEFAAPDYPAPGKAPPRHPELPLSVNGANRESWDRSVPRRAGQGAGSVPLRLTRYAQPSGREPKRVVLLIHGLAQGSLIYAHPAQPVSLASYLHGLGDDVWLVDYRLSNQFSEALVPYDGWTIDDIAEFDMPTAVNHVLAQYPPGTKVHVFAHCVGAVATSMAILAGRLKHDQLASVALNAIHPWIVPSPANDFRARLGVFVRDYLTDDFFDPRIRERGHVGAAWSLLDRVAFSLARLGEIDPASPRVTVNPVSGERLDPGHGRDSRDVSEGICDRMTFLYGRMWRHENTRAVHEHWADLVGRAPGTVQRQLYYLLNRQRVVSFEGENSFLTLDNLPNWAGIRTLFMHGDRSDVFNPQSADRSAKRLRIAFDTLGVATPVGLKRIPEYGHMDVILADEASSTTFPYLDAFFDGRFDEGLESGDLSLDEPKSHHDEGAVLAPGVGPILRGARIDDGRLQLRCWFEQPTMTTTRLGSPQLVEPRGAQWDPLRLRNPPPACNVPGEYHWADVYLDPADYRPLEVHAPGTGPSGPTRRVIRNVVAPVSALQPLRSAAEAPAPQPVWLERLLARNATGPVEDCHFIVGSCQYPGTPFDRESADGVFGPMLEFIERREPCDALFLLGDQIYADATAGLLDPSPWRDRYTERYRDAFRSAALSKVLASLPVHFAVDDHEFADNFPGMPVVTSSSSASPAPYRPSAENFGARVRAGQLSTDEFKFARLMACAYLGSGRDLAPFGTSSAGAECLWYALEHGNEFPCPAFMLDTRSERRPAASGQRPRLMGDAQLQALLEWLVRSASERPEDPKFIFSGSVIAPLSRDAAQDGWRLREDGLAGYPHELDTIVRTIVSHQVRRVVFVGGDLHLSAGCRLSLDSGARSVAALQVVASGLYAPLPFANFPPGTVDWNRPNSIELGGSRIDYTPQLLHAGSSHFVQVSARRSGTDWEIGLAAYDSAGAPVNRLGYTI